MDNQTPDEFLDSVEGEISFFRSMMRARPVGIHRHFHVLAIRNAIHNDTGRVIPIESIWAKLRTYYDLEALESAVRRQPLSIARLTTALTRRPHRKRTGSTTRVPIPKPYARRPPQRTSHAIPFSATNSPCRQTRRSTRSSPFAASAQPPPSPHRRPHRPRVMSRAKRASRKRPSDTRTRQTWRGSSGGTAIAVR